MFSYHFREHEGYYCGPYMYQKDQDETRSLRFITCKGRSEYQQAP